MQLSREPLDAQLKPWIERLWLHEALAEPAAARELCMPSARTRLVLRLQGPPMRRFRGLGDTEGVVQPRLQCCGLRRRALLRSPADSGLSLGVELRAGGSLALLGIAADRLAGEYVELEDVLPASLRRAFRALQRQPADLRLLDRLEELLLACLHWVALQATAPRPVAATLDALSAGTPVLRLAVTSGLSHRAWLAQFRASVGCTPREWLGLMRFGRALQGLSQPQPLALSELALAAGFHDQPHLTRSFVLHAGLSPGAYLRSRSVWPQHLLLP